MSLRQFAEHLGVNDAAVSKWERRAGLARLRHQTQQILDLDLARSSEDVQARFQLLLLTGGASTPSRDNNDSVSDEPVAVVDPGVPVAAVAGEQDAVPAGLPALRRALNAHDLPGDGPVRSLDELQQAVASVVRMRLYSSYHQLVGVLPALLAELHRALAQQVGQRRAEVARLLAQAYRAADAVAAKFGYYDLSAHVIELMAWAARESGDETTIAAAAYVRGETFFVTGDLETGRRLLASSADRLLPGSSVEAAAAYGALHMRAAVLAARAGRPATADDHAAEARRAAGRVPEAIYQGTAFGPASVRIHQLTLALDAGDPDGAVRVVEGWSPPSRLPAERRSHFYVDLARAQAAVGRPELSLDALLAARQIAPEHIQVHPHVHQLLADLARTGLSRTGRLVEFGGWVRPPAGTG